jgi:membrane fusion protein (multidrug efflux system)
MCYFIDNRVDETTSTFLAKARMPNPGGTLLPGEYVKLQLVVDQLDNAVVAPAPAVMETETGPTVYIVDKQGKVAMQQVEAAQSYEGYRIITKGLDPGVPVIVEGLQLIRPGIPVKTEVAVLPRQARDGAKISAGSPRGEKVDGSTEEADRSSPSSGTTPKT